MKTETISAISTALGTAGVGIIRMSGSDAISIAGKIFDKPRATTGVIFIADEIFTA